MSGASGESGYSAGETVRDRCRAMGLASWRADSAGQVIEEPAEPGLAGLWLRSGHVNAAVALAGLTWAEDPRPSLIKPAPGCWLIPIIEEQRRRRVGLRIALAMSEEALTSDFFRSACLSARLEEDSARSMLRRFACFDEEGVRRTAAILQWMVRDLAQLGEYQEAVDGFTNELTDSYETIDLLYGLGRSMLDLNQPEKFVALLSDRLAGTMPFGWVAARFEAGETAVGTLASQVVIRGTPPRPPAELGRSIERLRSNVPADRRSFMIGSEEIGAEAGKRVLVQPISRGTELAGLLLVGDKHGDDPQISSYDTQLLEAAAAFTGAFLENSQLYRDHQAMFMGTLKALTSAIDAKDRYTCGHSERVALVAAKLARAAGLDSARAERVHICGLLHDVGKIGVPEAVLSKPGRLTEEEFAQIRLHPEIGHRILRDIPQLTDVLPGVLHHHERWDGGGYPHRLAGEDVPMIARLIGLADSFDAMSSTRSYRSAMRREVVMAEIRRAAGSQFEPGLVSLLMGLDLSDYDAMVARHASESTPAAGYPAAAAA